MAKTKTKAVTRGPRPEKKATLRKDVSPSAHQDGWSNVISGLGTNQDKRLYNMVTWDPRTPQFFEQLYSGDELASRIVNVVPDEALRRWVEWIHPEKDISKLVEKRCELLDLKGGIERAWKWGRAYGGGVLYIVTDTSDPGSPLRPGYEKVIGLRDLSRWDLRILTSDIEYDFGSPNWGHPNYYYLNLTMGVEYKGYPIHWTRIIRFDGYLLPRRTFISNNYWHDSILNRLYNAIRNYQTANDAAASVLQDFNVGIYKMKNVANHVAAGKEQLVKDRINLLQFSKSAIRAMILDSDTEEYEDMSRSVDGLAELLSKQANRLVAATDITHTKLLGESPDGSNATGNSTTQQWFDHIQSEQENYLRPKLRRLCDAVFYDIPELDFKFRSLYQLTELEQADLRNKQSITDRNYIESRVLDPSEVAESRFGSGAYSWETTLDEENRNAGLIPQPWDAGQPEQSQEGDGQFGEGPSGSPYAATGIEPPEGVSQEIPQANEEATEIPASLQSSRMNPNSVEMDKPSTAYDFNNETGPIPEKVKPFISITMSEPMRDPKTNPILNNSGGKNNRKIEPTRGNGVTAASGTGTQYKQQKEDLGESSLFPRQLDATKKKGADLDE